MLSFSYAQSLKSCIIPYAVYVLIWTSHGSSDPESHMTLTAILGSVAAILSSVNLYTECVFQIVFPLAHWYA